jgi:ATP-binding protein involved in chromosome partitioning
MFKKVNVPILGVVENMSVFCCPDCGRETAIFGAHGARNMAAELGYELLAEVPLEMAVREQTDSGTPVVMAAPETKAAAAYRQLAKRVWEQLQAAPVKAQAGVKIVIE